MKTLWEICEKDPKALHRRVEPSEVSECTEAIKKIHQALEECDATNCFGLAANQLGLNIRACVLRIPSHYFKDKPKGETVVLEFYNPEIVEWSGSAMNQEWCYSLSPDDSYVVRRYSQIIIRDAKNGFTGLSGVPAYAAQHEIDHLNGKLISDKGTPAIDFINNAVGKIDGQAKNSLCKCGSGKKHKRCCGKP